MRANLQLLSHRQRQHEDTLVLAELHALQPTNTHVNTHVVVVVVVVVYSQSCGEIMGLVELNYLCLIHQCVGVLIHLSQQQNCVWGHQQSVERGATGEKGIGTRNTHLA